MAQTKVLTASSVFPAGTSVSVYARGAGGTELPLTGVPAGGVVAGPAVVAASGTLTFTGLPDAARLVAYAQVSGKDRYLRFDTDPVAGLDKTDGQQGIYAPTMPIGNKGNTRQLGPYAYLARFVPSRDMLIRSIAFMLALGDGGAGDTVDVGIYGIDEKRLGSSGLVTGKTNGGAVQGAQSVPLTAPVLVKANTVYYAALVLGAGNTGAPTFSVCSLGGFEAFTGFAAMMGGPAFDLGAVEMMVAAGGGPLPAILIGGVGNMQSVGHAPLLALREF